MHTLLFFIFAFLVIVPAAFAATVSIDMPSSGTVENTAYVYAYYYNNSVFVPGGSCTLSGGFLQSPVSFTYNAGGYYVYALYLASAGSHTFTISCSKAGYPDASNSASISVAKLSSTMSMDSSPAYSASVGDKVRLRVYYNSGSKISGASCNLKATAPSGSQDNIGMSEVQDQYYAEYTLSSVGQYTFSADCSSNNYLSNSASLTLQSSKRSSTLIQPTIPQYYAGDQISLYYRYESGGKVITDADCRYELKGGTYPTVSGRLNYTSNGYILLRAAPDASNTPYSLKVSCESAGYLLAQTTDSIYVKEIPTYLELTASTPDGAYSYTSVAVSLKYTDSRAGSVISGSDCSIDFLGNKIAGTSASMTFPAVTGAVSEKVIACCSKKNYAKRCEQQDFVVSPQPILMGAPADMFKIVIVGKAVPVSISAKPAQYGDAGLISCSIVILDSKGATAKKMPLERFGEEYRGNLSFDNPGRFKAETYCSGYGFAETRSATDIQAKMFTPGVESTLTTTLGILGLILVAAIILISKKYKI